MIARHPFHDEPVDPLPPAIMRVIGAHARRLDMSMADEMFAPNVPGLVAECLAASEPYMLRRLHLLARQFGGPFVPLFDRVTLVAFAAGLQVARRGVDPRLVAILRALPPAERHLVVDVIVNGPEHLRCDQGVTKAQEGDRPIVQIGTVHTRHVE